MRSAVFCSAANAISEEDLVIADGGKTSTTIVVSASAGEWEKRAAEDLARCIEQMSGAPTEIVAKLAATGAHHLYIDGGITIQEFLRAGLIQRLIITRVPVLIGEGIPLFGKLPHDVKLRHMSTQQYASGLVKSEYHVA